LRKPQRRDLPSGSTAGKKLIRLWVPAGSTFRATGGAGVVWDHTPRANGIFMKRLHLFMAFVVAAAFATASSAAAQTQWTEYRIAGGDYRIEFPAAPKEVVRKLPSGIPTYTASLAPDTNTYFSVTANAIVSSMLSKPTEILLDLARNGQVRGTKGTLREEERLTVGGAPARRLVIDSSPYVLYVLLVVKGDQLYQALYVAASGHDNQADMLHFLGSFGAQSK
jgi:hypothetical protein